jgi:hypothetical protein
MLGPRTVLALVGVYALLLNFGVDLVTMATDWLAQEVTISLW